jgi:hypothetical protein
MRLSKYASLLITSFFLYSTMSAQEVKTKIQQKNYVIYFGFGTNRSFYSKSDISLRSSVPPTFDFTLENARAKDDQGLKFNNGGAPQYSYQLGFYNKKKNFGIEFNFDHVKYFLRQNQVVHLKGTINNKFYDVDTLITPDFIQFEHSDGANYALFNFVKWKNLAQSRNGKQSLDLMMKAGAGPVIPKTNSTFMGKHRDDVYKISGFVVALEGGLRYTFLKNLFIEGSFKGAYADYTRFVIADGTGKQSWFGAHLNALLGAQVNL